MPSLLHLRCLRFFARHTPCAIRAKNLQPRKTKKRKAISEGSCTVPEFTATEAVRFHRKPVLNVHLIGFRLRKHDFLRLYTVFSFFCLLPRGGFFWFVGRGRDHRTTPIPIRASSSDSLWATTRSDDTPHNYTAGGFMQNFTRFLLLLPLLLLLMATDTTNTAEPRVCGVCLYTDCLTD